jgi:hypothetical protein
MPDFIFSLRFFSLCKWFLRRFSCLLNGFPEEGNDDEVVVGGVVIVDEVDEKGEEGEEVEEVDAENEEEGEDDGLGGFIIR